jgi:hypothetical protein
MKAVKFVLIAAFVSFVMMGFSVENPYHAKSEKLIAIEKAMMDRVILRAMDYISEDLIAVERDGYYYAKVRVRNNMITIYGDYPAWQQYFIQRKWVGVNNKPIRIDRFVY